MIIDLSVPVENEMPFYPGDPQPRLREIKIKDYMVHELLIGTHTGTHVDVPYHFIPEGKRLDQIPLERFMGKAYVTDSVDHAEPAEMLLVYTGTSKKWRKGWKMEDGYATLSLMDAEKIVKNGYKMVGIDSPSVGDTDVHNLLLRNEVLIVENLSQALEKLVGAFVYFQALPLNIVGVDGSPVRAIAIVQGME